MCRGSCHKVLDTPTAGTSPPTRDTSLCRPQQTSSFMATLASHDCPDCLPDCEDTTYQHSITSTTLRRCDTRNLNLRPLCTLERGPLPKLWLAQVKEVYRRTTNSTPPYIAALAGRRSRHFDSLLELPSGAKSDTYDAWEEDIALINIYFGKASITGRLVMSIIMVEGRVGLSMKLMTLVRRIL